MKMSKGKVFLALMVLCILATLTFAFRPQQAQAGTNGQQIRFDCPSMNAGVVKGYNQNGQYVTWQTNASGYFVTTGYWWVGWGRIYYWNRSTNTWRSVAVNVPKVQWYSDIYYVRC